MSRLSRRPYPQRVIRPLIERTLEKYAPEPNSGCWLWVGATNNKGYGMIGQGRRPCKTLLAHRVTYEAFMGPISEELELDHLCRVRSCINPKHLEPVTHQVNAARGETGKYRR